MTSSPALLAMRGISIAFGDTVVVEHLDLEIATGETVGLVGESGCGKSMTGRAVLDLLPGEGAVTAGSIRFDGADLALVGQRAMRRLRGSRIALVSQDPIAALDPMWTIGRQVDELVRCHHGGSRAAVRARTLGLLREVRLPDPAAVVGKYPHELSGGMAQRVAIAMALSGEPRLLIADEPTTALDVTVQAEILALLRQLQADRGMSILLITHDLAVIAALCRRAYVMYAGHIVESGPVRDLFDRPLHPYTAGLLEAMPTETGRGGRLVAIPGTVPAPAAWPRGCHFWPRCPLAIPDCSAAPVPVVEPVSGRLTRCFRAADVPGRRHRASA